MILNMICGGGAGGDIDKSQIIVTTESGSTVTCSKGTDVRTASESSGTWRFTGLDNGTWTIMATKNGSSASTSVIISKLSVVYVTLSYRKVPEFTYTGDYELVNDDDTPLTDFLSENWKLRLLSSGILTFNNMRAWNGMADVFIVGGGGGGSCSGGGGGFTATTQATVTAGTDYTITVGAGGAGGQVEVAGGAGGASEAFSTTANGGGGAAQSTKGAGGNGGCGGGGYSAGAGGSDGSDGVKGYANAGTGQGTTTREFGESGATLYAGGGGGAGKPGGAGGEGGGGAGSNTEEYTTDPGKDGAANTGGGGGGYAWSILTAGAGGSGIVIIRNKR